jgi:hypothetical protein
MQTYTGVPFDFTNIRPEDINLEDIARSLSLQCRFNGHTLAFYSVAQHSVLVSRVVIPSPGDTIATQKWGLLHDAAEAYVCDLPRPVKEWLRKDSTAYTSSYDVLEGAIAVAIRQKFVSINLDHDIKMAVHHADNVLLATEKRDLMAPCPRDWGELPEPMTQTIVPVFGTGEGVGDRMNPDTNKFEGLFKISAEQQEELLQRTKVELQDDIDRLRRADGSPVPNHWSVFAVGENVVVKDYTFKIAHIGEGYMVLEPVGIPIIGDDK